MSLHVGIRGPGHLARVFSGASAPVPSAVLRIGLIGDSITAGRSSGIGPVSMQGARALSWPTQLVTELAALGVNASANSIGEANNTGDDAPPTGGIQGYDPRVVPSTWSQSGANTAGGRMLNTSTSGVTCAITFDNIDTFILFVPVDAFGVITYNVDGGSPSSYNLNKATSGGVARVQAITIPCGSLGTHTLNVTRTSGSVFISNVFGYNSAVPDVQLINMGVRNWSTSATTWGDASSPWRPLAALGYLDLDWAIIVLGTNTALFGGDGQTQAQFLITYQNIITALVGYGVTPILGYPTPFDPTSERVDFTQADLRTLIGDLATTNSLETVDLESWSGSYATMNAAGEMAADGIHPDDPAVFTRIAEGLAAWIEARIP